MVNYNEAIQIAKNKIDTNQMTVSEANVYIVQLMGVRIIKSRMPKEVRTALNNAVKNGDLGHIKKDGLKPEAYYHKNARSEAIMQRNNIARESLQCLSKITC